MDSAKHKLNYRLLRLNNMQNPRFIDKNDVGVARYFRDIRKYKPLGQDEEQEMIIKIKANAPNSEQLKAKLIGSHLPFVIMFAKRYCPRRGGFLLDLIQEGNYGMLVALDNFNMKINTKFLSYANAWIIKYMFAFLAKNNLIKRNNRTRTFGIDTRLRNEFFNTYGYEPTSQDMLDMFAEIGIPIKHKEDLDEITVLPLDVPPTVQPMEVSDDSEIVIEYGEDNTIAEDLDTKLNIAKVREVMKELTPLESYIIRKKFGFDDGIEEDANYIARELHTTSYAVNKAMQSAFRKIRRHRALFGE